VQTWARRAALVAAPVLATAVVTVVAPAASAEGRVLAAAGRTAIPDSYLVTLKDTAQLRSDGISSSSAVLARRYGGRVERTYTHAIAGFEASMSPTEAARLAADPAIARVQQNAVVRLAAVTQSNPPSWGLDRMDQRALPLSRSYRYAAYGSNVHAYVLDSGIRFTHRDFGGRAVSGPDTYSKDGDSTDCHGHGTHVAGTIGGATHGVAKRVQLVGLRVVSCTGTGTVASLVAGIDWVVANAVRPAVINISLALGGADPTTDAAVSRAVAAGITVVAAAGNSGASACNESPGRVPGAVTVGATGKDDARPSWSNYGACLDVFAPGSDITSDWASSDTATLVDGGTSMAAPHVTGAAVLILSQNPGWSPAQVASAITSSATTGVVGTRGTNSPNRLLYTGPGTVGLG
jgi:subtilisin family serine protease